MKSLIASLVILAVILLGIGFIGTYQANVYMPAVSPWTAVVSQGVNLQSVLNMYKNYDLVSCMPYQGGYILVYKNRNKLVDMWQ
jgi:hypothetical protein